VGRKTVFGEACAFMRIQRFFYIAKRPHYLSPELRLAMGRSGIGLVFAAADIGEG